MITYISEAVNALTTTWIPLAQSAYEPEEGVAFEDAFHWVDTREMPFTLDELKVKATELQAEYDANAYARSRKAAYDALNQLELISDDAINGTTTHADAILAIKAEFPKP